MNVDAVIVGLGNPGQLYSFTRHNVGFIALDILAQRLNFTWLKGRGVPSKIFADMSEGSWGSVKVLLLKPQTFMNHSGKTIAALYDLHEKLKEKPLIVFHDEVDLPFGKVAAKFGGGVAGHNGLRSIFNVLGHGDFYRLRFGVGKPETGSETDLSDYVLAPFPKVDEANLLLQIEKGLKAVKFMAKGMLPEAQAVAAKDL